MSLTSRLIHTITVYQLEQADSGLYNDPIVTLDAGTEYPAWVEPLLFSKNPLRFESNQDRLSTVSYFTVTCKADVPIQVSSKVEWKGRMHEVVGRPQNWSNRNGEHHIEFDMRLEEM